MSAPVTDSLSSSISSSGHTDGLGRRALAFDRESGGVLERLHVRPELAVFEQVIRRRVSQVSTLEDERFARPLRIERDGNGDLVVVSEFVTGSRLSDLLDVAADSAVVPGVDVALGYLLEALPALVALHGTGRVTHGLIDPSRTVLTPAGQVAFLDLGFGPIVEILRLSPDRLWTDFGVSTLASGAPFDAASDITQVALSSLMLVLGRSLRPDEHPEAIGPLLREVIEVAHIRGSTAFATGLERFLQRSLPLPGRRPFEAAEEALADVRNFVKHEIGLDVCKQGLVDFIAQMDAAYAASLDADPDADADADAGNPGGKTDAPTIAATSPVSAIDLQEPEFEGIAFTVLEEPEVQALREPAPVPAPDDHLDEDDGEELELSLVDQPEPSAPVHAEEVYDLAASDPSFADPAAVTSELASLGGIALSRNPEPARQVWNAPAPAPEELPVASATAAIEAPAALAAAAIEPASHPLPEFAPVEPPAAAECRRRRRRFGKRRLHLRSRCRRTMRQRSKPSLHRSLLRRHRQTPTRRRRISPKAAHPAGASGSSRSRRGRGRTS